jgi:signal transduction histidine kinase
MAIRGIIDGNNPKTGKPRKRYEKEPSSLLLMGTGLGAVRAKRLKAARWFTDQFGKRSGITVKLELPDRMDRLSEIAKIALFRILQESLTNVHRHSGSSVVEVGLKASGDKAVLTVRDFGRGMPAGFTQGSRPNGDQFGVGLGGMRERVNDLGGSFYIECGNDGMAIIVPIPLATEIPNAGISGRNNAAA